MNVGIGQPCVQTQLSRLSHRPHEQKQTERGEDIYAVASKNEALACQMRSGREYRIEIQSVKYRPNAHNTQGKAEIADSVDDEGLHRGGIGVETGFSMESGAGSQAGLERGHDLLNMIRST